MHVVRRLFLHYELTEGSIRWGNFF